MRNHCLRILLFLFILPINGLLVWGQSAPERNFSRMDLLDGERVITLNDRLRYRVLEEQSPEVILSSDSEGKIRFAPLLKAVPVVGKTCYDLAHELKALLEVDFFYRATVSIEIASSSYREFVTIYGQVKNQGRVSLPQNGFMTISQVLSNVGGSIEGANLNNVEIRRKNDENPDKEDSIFVDVDSVINGGKVENDIRLAANDVIIVTPKDDVGGRYSVLGAVKQPGLFTIAADDLTVSEAILMAGGFTEVARRTKVKLTRRLEDSDESENHWINVKNVLEGDRNEDMIVKKDDIINVSEKFIVF